MSFSVPVFFRGHSGFTVTEKKKIHGGLWKRYRDTLYCSDMSAVTGQGNDFKVKAGSLRLDIKKKLSTMSMVTH